MNEGKLSNPEVLAVVRNEWNGEPWSSIKQKFIRALKKKNRALKKNFFLRNL